MLHYTVNTTVDPVISEDLLSSKNQIISICILSIYFIFGLIGNIFNICLFTRPALFRTSSSLYLLSTSIGDLIVTILVIPFRLAADGFNKDLSAYSLLSCRLISYIYYVCLALPPYLSVFACVDRWAASCVQVNRRRFANTRTAKRCIPLIIILLFLLYSYILIIFALDPNPPPPYCSFNRTYAMFGLSFQLITYSFVPPFLMALFSIGIIFNVRRGRIAVLPAIIVANRPVNGGIARRDRRRLSQMQIMLVCQSILECILTLPFSIINLISMVVKNDAYFYTVYSFVRLLIFINYISSFYVYTLSSKLYRDELKKLAQRIYNRHERRNTSIQ